MAVRCTDACSGTAAGADNVSYCRVRQRREERASSCAVRAATRACSCVEHVQRMPQLRRCHRRRSGTTIRTSPLRGCAPGGERVQRSARVRRSSIDEARRCSDRTRVRRCICQIASGERRMQARARCHQQRNAAVARAGGAQHCACEGLSMNSGDWLCRQPGMNGNAPFSVWASRWRSSPMSSHAAAAACSAAAASAASGGAPASIASRATAALPPSQSAQPHAAMPYSADSTAARCAVVVAMSTYEWQHSCKAHVSPTSRRQAVQTLISSCQRTSPGAIARTARTRCAQPAPSRS